MPEEDIKSIIDDWLSKVPQVACFTERMKIYTPTCNGTCKKEVDQLIERINRIFYGSTVYDQCTGCWLDEKKGEVECEPVKVIEVAHNCSSKEDLKQMMDAITDYAISTGQKSISIQNGRFYIAESKKLMGKYEELTKEVPA